MKTRVVLLVSLLAIASMLLTACPAPTPQVVVQTVEVEKKVVETQVVEKKVVETQVVEKVVEKPVEKTVVVTAEVFDPKAALKGKKLAGIFPGPINDAGWNAQAYLAALNMRDKYGMDVAFTDNVVFQNAAQVARTYAEQGYEYIWGHSYDYDDPFREVAKDYPNIKFIVDNGSAKPGDNVYTYTDEAGPGGYFVGRMACEMSKTKKIALVAAMTWPLMDHHHKMMAQGCKDAGGDPNNVMYSVIGSWDDPAKAKELAVADLQQGADVLITIANTGDAAVIEAVRDAYNAGNKDVRLISWSADKHSLGPEFITSGYAQDTVKGLEWTLTEVIAKGKPGGHYTAGLKEGTTYFYPFYGLVDPAVEKDHVDTLRKYLEDPAAFPQIEVRTDL
jgi:basic membrane protein A and related proteins